MYTQTHINVYFLYSALTVMSFWGNHSLSSDEFWAGSKGHPLEQLEVWLTSSGEESWNTEVCTKQFANKKTPKNTGMIKNEADM